MQKYIGSKVHLRAIIEFSNYCKQNCLYCGLRRDNSYITRYPIEPHVIIESSRKAKNYDCKTIVLQSGEGSYYTAEKMIKIISGQALKILRLLSQRKLLKNAKNTAMRVPTGIY
jgi:biotin synthase